MERKLNFLTCISIQFNITGSNELIICPCRIGRNADFCPYVSPFFSYFQFQIFQMRIGSKCFKGVVESQDYTIFACQIKYRRNKTAFRGLISAINIGACHHIISFIIVRRFPHIITSLRKLDILYGKCTLPALLAKRLFKDCHHLLRLFRRLISPRSFRKVRHIIRTSYRKLPASFETSQDTGYASFSFWQLIGCKVGIRAGTYHNDISVAILYVLFPIVILRSKSAFSAILECYAGKFHQFELIAVHIGIHLADIIYYKRSHILRICPTVFLHVCLKLFPRCTVKIPVGVSQLQLIAIHGKAQSFQVDINRLPYGIVIIHAVLVHFHFDGAGFVLQINLLEDISRLVIGSDNGFHHFFLANGIGSILPYCCPHSTQFLYRGIGCRTIILGLVQRRRIIIALAGCEHKRRDKQ